MGKGAQGGRPGLSMVCAVPWRVKIATPVFANGHLLLQNMAREELLAWSHDQPDLQQGGFLSVSCT